MTREAYESTREWLEKNRRPTQVRPRGISSGEAVATRRATDRTKAACRDFQMAVKEGLDAGIPANVMVAYLMQDLGMTDLQVRKLITDCMVVLEGR